MSDSFPPDNYPACNVGIGLLASTSCIAPLFDLVDQRLVNAPRPYEDDEVDRMNRVPRNFVNFSAAAGYNVKNRERRKEKGAGVSASPPCRRTFGPRAAARAARAFTSAASPDPRRQGWRTRALGRWSANAFPRPVTGAGAIPKDRLPTSMSFAPPLPCGIGFAVSVIKSRRSRRIVAFRCPRPVHAASKGEPQEKDNFRAVGYPARQRRSTVRPDNPLHLSPEGLGFAFWSPGWAMLRGSISCPGGPPFPCRSIGETFWTPDPFRFHPTRSRERDGPFPGVVSPYRHAWFPEGTCACRSVANF